MCVVAIFLKKAAAQYVKKVPRVLSMVFVPKSVKGHHLLPRTVDEIQIKNSGKLEHDDMIPQEQYYRVRLERH